MEIRRVSDILATCDLRSPNLNALIPNADNYTVLAIQPPGDIVATNEGVRNRDRVLAVQQYDRFITLAMETQSDLVISPEYSLPWSVLVDVLAHGNGPLQGKIWALGCESIKVNELETLKATLSPYATVIYEPVDATSSRFVSPLAYVFIAPPTNGNGESKTVVLIQFKTDAMGDPDHFERNEMLRGNQVYKFESDGHHLSLVSLICADAFALTDDIAAAIHDHALILHIQLNSDPRNAWFVGCRERLLRYNGDTTEVLCLNWSENVQMTVNNVSRNWANISGSAWYVKSREFDDGDSTITDNHRQGLYYTYLQPSRSHALFFNYKPAIFLFVATKVAHVAVPGAVSRRRGPQLTRAYSWNAMR